MKIIYNIDIPVNYIPITGIEDIETVDFEYAEFINSTVKMIAHAEQINDEINIYITPTIISNNNQLSKVDGATNIVNINSENLGNTCLIGEGAGRYPTAQSVISDVISIINDTVSNPFNINKFDNQKKFNTNYSSSFYIRFTVKESIGIIYEISKICSNNLISIDSVLQLPHEKENINLVRFVIITENTKRSKIIDMIEEVNKLSFNLKKPIFFPIME